MLVKSEKMELRGISEKVSTKSGKSYKVANMESVSTGEPSEVYLGDGVKFKTLIDGKKGEHFSLVFNLNKYKSLDLVNVEKA